MDGWELASALLARSPRDGPAEPALPALDATDEQLRAIVRCIDLTSLSGEETPEDVSRLCETAAEPGLALPAVAAVCIFAEHVPAAVAKLSGTGVRVATVAGGFPGGTLGRTEKLEEVRAALGAGAAEVDFVLDRRPVRAGELRTAFDEVAAVREACGARTLKVILETGELEPGEARSAAIASLAAGADFVKTSTGKAARGATPAAALVLTEAAAEVERATGRRPGVKVSGGVRTAEQALGYAALHRALLGEATPDRFRIGASGLLDDLRARLAQTR